MQTKAILNRQALQFSEFWCSLPNPLFQRVGFLLRDGVVRAIPHFVLPMVGKLMTTVKVEAEFFQYDASGNLKQ